jgi:general secretion pathway protein L
MAVGASLVQWFEELAAILEEARQWREGRRAVLIRQEGERMVIRRALSANAEIVAVVPIGSPAPTDIAQSLRNRVICFELGAGSYVARRLVVPAQAKDVLSGIVRNQIERLSPWPVAATVYGFDSENAAGDAKSLNVQISISNRKFIDASCEQLAALGLAPHRIVARTDLNGSSVLLPLWTSLSATLKTRRVGSRPAIAALMASLLLASVGVTSWALLSANDIRAEREHLAVRIDALRQHGALSPAKNLSPLSIGERAWAMKESAPAVTVVLEALTKALPDSAYLSELTLDHATLRLSGFALDPPPLIAAMEQSNGFSGTHFSAATTKDVETSLYRFNIEAQIAPQLALAGE